MRHKSETRREKEDEEDQGIEIKRRMDEVETFKELMPTFTAILF